MRDVIVIGASAGGIRALQALCARLPGDLPATLLIAQHILPTARSMLPELLARAGELPAQHAREGEVFLPSRIYVAPPDHHLLVSGNRLLVRRGPKENRTRPAADPLFRSAAVSHGPRVIGIVLSGLLDDGTAGLVAIKRCGGVAIAQDPEDADWPDMPRHAIRADHVDFCSTMADLPALLERLVHEPVGPAAPVPEDLVAETHIAEMEFGTVLRPVPTVGVPSRLSCPECGGILNEIDDAGVIRFRCQIGHGFALETLIEAQTEALDHALLAALRTHQERIVLCEQLAAHAQEQGRTGAARRWLQAAEDAHNSAELVAAALRQKELPPTADPAGSEEA